SQANELEQRVGGSVPNDVIAVGHSNGGVVARQWSRSRNVGALITLGSPNQGAPIVDHLYEWLRFVDDILVRVSNVEAIFSHINQDQWWWLPAQWATYFAFGVDTRSLASVGLTSFGIDRALPVISEMGAWSPFMANLNSAASRDREA